MDNYKIELLRKFVNNQCTLDELIQVDQLIRNCIKDELWVQLMDEVEADNTGPSLSEEHRQKLYASIEPKITATQQRQHFLRRPLVLSIAASLLLLTGLFIFNIVRSDRKQSHIISLVTLNEPQPRQLQIPDGSVVWINSNSSLRYPEQFASDQRNVQLEGEAFFNVTKDTKRPFIVTTQDLRIKVLGTSFNVKSFHDDEEIVVTLVSGLVQVEIKGVLQHLSPGEQFRYNKRLGAFEVHKVKADEASLWKDKWLVFNSTSLHDIAKNLERWYNVNVRIDDEKLKDVNVTLKQKDASLIEVLDIISFSAGIEYEISGRIVIIKTKKE